MDTDSSWGTPQVVGVENLNTQFREDKRLRVHETPFELRYGGCPLHVALTEGFASGWLLPHIGCTLACTVASQCFMQRAGTRQGQRSCLGCCRVERLIESERAWKEKHAKTSSSDGRLTG